MIETAKGTIRETAILRAQARRLVRKWGREMARKPSLAFRLSRELHPRATIAIRKRAKP